MSPEGLLRTMTVEGAADTEAFLLYLDELAARPGLTARPDGPDG